MVETFGVERIMMGGDWPVIVLGNSYVEVWKAQLEVIDKLSPEQKSWLKSKTVKSVYNL